MPAPEYKEEMRKKHFPVDANTRPVNVLYFYDPVTNQVVPASTVGITGAGQVLNTNLVGGVMQVENLHVEMDSTGLHNVAGDQINPATEGTLQDILETLGGSIVSPRILGFSIFGATTVLANGVIPTTIVSYTVPAGKRYRITGARAWADVDAEYCVMIDSDQVDGYRTTAADITMNISTAGVQYAAAGQVITIGATHFKVGIPRIIKAVIQGSLETI
jgi:hypothetical protein